MRIIFKKFRTRMIVGCILAVIALLAVSVVVFINQPSFGRTPRGERLERVMKSPNYRNGGYDTHYAEIGASPISTLQSSKTGNTTKSGA